MLVSERLVKSRTPTSWQGLFSEAYRMKTLHIIASATSEAYRMKTLHIKAQAVREAYRMKTLHIMS